LLAILKIAFSEHGPMQYPPNPAILLTNKRMRELGIEAAAASVSVHVDEDGVTNDKVVRWMQTHQAWRHVRHVALVFCGSTWISRIPTVSALDLPAQPLSANVGLYIRGDTTVPWASLLPFSKTAVTHVHIDGDPTFALDVAALLEAFPCLVRLDVGAVETEPYSTKKSLPIPLRHFRKSARETSGLLRYLLGRSPNLLTAAVVEPLAIAPLRSPSRLQDLAVTLTIENVTDCIHQFDGLAQLPSLRRLAFRQSRFPSSDDSRPCDPIPKTVRHLAFHNVFIPDCLQAIRHLAQ
jgi:hypothetical protein